MVRNILILILSLCCSLATAQETLNIHTKSQGVIIIYFSQKPEVSFAEGDVLKIVGTDLSVEYPFSDVEQVTFGGSADGVDQIVHTDTSSCIHIYDLSGKLIQTIQPQGNVTRADLHGIPPGVYIIKDSTRSYKIIKK